MPRAISKSSVSDPDPDLNTRLKVFIILEYILKFRCAIRKNKFEYRNVSTYTVKTLLAK